MCDNRGLPGNRKAVSLFRIRVFTTNHLSSLFDSAVALVYPQACAVCGQSVESRTDGVACSPCWNATRVFDTEDTLCWKCGAFTPATVSEDRRRKVRCGQCDADSYSAARAVGFYEGALRASILSLKREPHIAPRLTQLVLTAQQCEPINQATLIIPVPLHSERERERGFNQAAMLGRSLSRLSKLPFDEHSVMRCVHTALHRAGMDARARRDSVADAFAVRHPERIVGQRILLVDDVFTTGATASACAAVLKEAGASEVFVLTVARA